MSHYTETELAFLREDPRGGPGGPRLARIATVGGDGTPHVVPVGWRDNHERIVSRGLAGERGARSVA